MTFSQCQCIINNNSPQTQPPSPSLSVTLHQQPVISRPVMEYLTLHKDERSVRRCQCDARFCLSQRTVLVLSFLGLQGISFKIPSHNFSSILGKKKFPFLDQQFWLSWLKIINKIVHQILVWLALFISIHYVRRIYFATELIDFHKLENYSFFPLQIWRYNVVELTCQSSITPKWQVNFLN